jgi:hypothetical protein
MTSPDLHPGELPGALCPQTDPEVFFPEPGGSPAAAKKVCAACEVRSDCLALALSLGPVMGVWGGLTERERARRKRAARVPTSGRRICPGCENEFTKPTSHAIYCGDLCRQKARRATKAASKARHERTAA